MTQALAQQIREGKTAMDISQEEKELNDWLRRLIQQRKILQNQQENEEKRITGLQETIDQDDITHEAALKVMEQKRRDLAQALANSVPTPDDVLTPPNYFEKQIEKLEEDLAVYVFQREKARTKDIENLENEKSRWKALYEAQEGQLNSEEEAANHKRKAIEKWKGAHTTVARVSPLHQFLEIYFPIIMGVIAIWSLISAMLHFPLPPNPPSLPGF